MLLKSFTGVAMGRSAPVSLRTKDDVRFVTVYDMDRDGIPDLILSGHALVRIQHGLGNRTFEATPTYLAANPFPQKVRVADVNGDGSPDLLVPNGGYSSIMEPGYTFTVLLNASAPPDPAALAAAVNCRPEPSANRQPFACTDAHGRNHQQRHQQQAGPAPPPASAGWQQQRQKHRRRPRWCIRRRLSSR